MQPALTNLLHKSCFALINKIEKDAELKDNIHLSAEMFDGWQRKSVLVEPRLADGESYTFHANIVDKNKFDQAAFQTVLNECTQNGLVVSIKVIDDCDITNTMTIAMAWKTI
ncbi:hypothetical protein OTK49_21245 [Vibrio coralliirubri]|uniref:hypothetical protein n=1 Tax=Vibrio coralliirubri TaxID=1516159 RepID=UPI002283BE1A|nr:hypothetical protein [Vibrio coralliirubri]MCY9865047.1 hypothetical protein [Vibrio coralliirubri]